jgi:transcriptional regulator with XRE-family HTH domain
MIFVEADMAKRNPQKKRESVRASSDRAACVSKNVLRFRLQKRWSQTELAQASGCSQKSISRLESGIFNMHHDHIEHVAVALGVPLTALFNGVLRDKPKAEE